MSAETTRDTEWTFGGTWPYEPRFFTTSDQVRIHYVDEGPRDGEPVVMLHGNPTWSYLYRHFIRALTAAGFRAIAYDYMGFGRSDKPTDLAAYTVQRHAQHFASLMAALELDGVTLVVHDWGGPIGITWASRHRERVKRLVLLNTAGGARERFPLALRLLGSGALGPLVVQRIHLIVRIALLRVLLLHRERLGPWERAAYLAPHPTPESRAGILAFVRLMKGKKTSAEPLLARYVESVRIFADRPILICWGMRDRILAPWMLERWRERFPEAEVHEIEDAGHYIQEDAHEQVVPFLVSFLRRTRS